MAMSSTRKTVLIITGIVAGLVLVALIGLAVLVAAFRKGPPTIRDNSVLALSVAGPLPDYVPEDPLRRFFGGTDQSLTNLLLQFKKAKADTRIKAIILDIDFSGAGWGKAEEIRDAIADFRSSGKQVYGYLEYGANKEYYIASACDQIYVAPPGELFINGLAADVMFFRGTLDKLGIYPDMYQIGKYKSAGDMFTRKEMSEAHREYINSLLDDLFKGATKEKLVGRCKRDLMEAKLKLRSGDPFTMLRAVLRRLTVLRNRVMHGCVTYGTVSKGLPSVVKGARVARALMPALYELMATRGHGVKWDPIPYPRVGFEDPLDKLMMLAEVANERVPRKTGRFWVSLIRESH